MQAADAVSRGDRMVYWRIVRSSYRRNLQYRLSHLVNNLASAIFGLIYIAIWAGGLAGKEASSPYDIRTMAAYISLCQGVLWMSVFLSPGLGIQTGVRSGTVSLDLIRPINYMLHVLSHELGRIAYNACFRSVPIGLVLGIAVGFRLPAHPAVWLWTALSLCLAVYLGLLLFYLVGLTSFWTTEIRWAHYILMSLVLGIGRQMIPVDLLPSVLGEIAPYLPFAGGLPAVRAGTARV